MAINPLQWTDAAACRQADPSIFYAGDAHERREARDERELMAKRICAGCAVREECLAASLASREAYGIWGGLTEGERRALLRRLESDPAELARRHVRKD